MSLGRFFSHQSSTGRSLLFRILSEGFLSLKHFPLQNSSNSSSFPVIPPGSLHTLVSLKKIFSPPTPSLFVPLSASLFEEKAQKIYYFGKIFGRFLSSEELFTIHNLRILSECIFLFFSGYLFLFRIYPLVLPFFGLPPGGLLTLVCLKRVFSHQNASRRSFLPLSLLAEKLKKSTIYERFAECLCPRRNFLVSITSFRRSLSLKYFQVVFPSSEYLQSFFFSDLLEVSLKKVFLTLTVFAEKLQNIYYL